MSYPVISGSFFDLENRNKPTNWSRITVVWEKRSAMYFFLFLTKRIFGINVVSGKYPAPFDLENRKKTFTVPNNFVVVFVSFFLYRSRDSFALKEHSNLFR